MLYFLRELDFDTLLSYISWWYNMDECGKLKGTLNGKVYISGFLKTDEIVRKLKGVIS
jgi:hypothetical protein